MTPSGESVQAVDSGPETPALDAWYERPGRNRSSFDHPRVSSWYPQQAPHANVQSISRGCHEPSYLGRGTIHVNLNVAGVDIGGPIDEIEALIDAARDTLRLARYWAEQMEHDGCDGTNCAVHSATSTSEQVGQ